MILQQCLILVAGSLASTSAAFIPSTVDFTSTLALSNLTSTNIPARSDTPVVKGELRSWYCTKIGSWSLPKIEPNDCSGVLDYFYIETMEEGGGKLKEFRAPGSKKETVLETEWTPRKYTFGRVYLSSRLLPYRLYNELIQPDSWSLFEHPTTQRLKLTLSLEIGTCTLAIVMIQDFSNPASLPGGYKSGPPSDLSTYHNLWEVAESLVAQCGKRRGELGWQPTGNNENHSRPVILSQDFLQKYSAFDFVP